MTLNTLISGRKLYSELQHPISYFFVLQWQRRCYGFMQKYPRGALHFQERIQSIQQVLCSSHDEINFVSEAMTKTLKLLQVIVAVLVVGPCLFFISLVAFRSFIRKVDGIRFAPVPLVCNCFLSSIDETITQATRTKNSNVWKSASSPRSTNPDNFSSEYA